MKIKKRTTKMEICIVMSIQSEYDVDAMSELTGIHPELIGEIERVGLINRHRTDIKGRPIFDDAAVQRLRQIAVLRNSEKLSFRMIRNILKLTTRLEKAEMELQSVRHF